MVRINKKFCVGLAITVGILILVVSVLWYIGVLTDNLRVVTPGKFYRAGQMTGERLRQVVSQYKIRTIVNLRGSNKGTWYAEEKATVKELNVKYVNVFFLDQNRLPPPSALDDLLQVLREGPYPMLIHCKGGADRSGLASVIYRVVIEKAPFDSALNDQLSWRYGHFPVGEVRSMDDFFNLYLNNGKGKDLERWIHEDYPSLYYKWQMNRVTTTSNDRSATLPSCTK